MDLSYTIKTSAELQGAEAAADALERQIGKAKALKQDYSELQKQLDTMRSSISEANVAHESQTEAMTIEAAETEKLTLGKRELLESIRGVTRAFPMLGEAARAVFNPITVVVASLIGMIASVFSALKKVEDLELPDLTTGIDQADTLGEKWEGIGKSVGDADAAFSGWQESQARALKVINDELHATEDLIKAEKERAIAQLNVDRASGMDQGEYERKKSIIERGATAATTQAEIDANNAKAAALLKALNDAVAEANKKTAAAANAKGPDSPEKAQAEIAALKTLEDAERKKEEEAANRVKEITDMLTDAASAHGYGGNLMVGLERWRELTRHMSADNEPLSASPEQALPLQQQIAAEAKAKADGAVAEAARIAKEAKERERLNKEAESAAGKAEDLRNKTPAEIQALVDANKNLSARQNDNDTSSAINADASAFSSDEKRIKEDLSRISEYGSKNTITPEDTAKARAAMADMMSALQDASSSLSDLASLGADVAKLKTKMADLATQVAQAKAAADHR